MRKTGYIGAAIVVAACIIILLVSLFCRPCYVYGTQPITSLCAGLASYCFSREL